MLVVHQFETERRVVEPAGPVESADAGLASVKETWCSAVFHVEHAAAEVAFRSLNASGPRAPA